MTKKQIIDRLTQIDMFLNFGKFDREGKKELRTEQEALRVQLRGTK